MVRTCGIVLAVHGMNDKAWFQKSVIESIAIAVAWVIINEFYLFIDALSEHKALVGVHESHLRLLCERASQ